MSQYIFPSITEQVNVSGTLHIATVAAGAMFFHDSIDFSAYANRGYKLEFKDAAGKKAWAFGGSVGGGETLGGDILSGTGSFDSDTGWTLQAGWEITGGKAVATATSAWVVRNAFGIYRLYQVTADIVVTSGKVYLGQMIDSALVDSSGSYTTYTTAYAVTCGLRGYGASEFTGTADNLVAKQVLTPPATGLLLNSTPFGTDRTMAGSESGFNPNTVVLVRILGKAKQGRGRILGI